MATYVITGANRGIGLELTRQACEAGHRVIALCRAGSPALQQTSAEVHEGFDVADDGVTEQIATLLADTSVDVLINNAGILSQESLQAFDIDAVRRQFEINALGPLRVTRGLLGSLHAGSKIAIITSRMGSASDNSSGGSYGYRMSKAAVNIAGVSLARDLASKEIAVALIHPGWVKTDMTGNNGMIDAPDSARGILARIEALTLETSGTFWHQNGEVLPW